MTPASWGLRAHAARNPEAAPHYPDASRGADPPHDSGARLGPGGEFDRIREILRGVAPRPGSERPEGVQVGPGDDAAVLQGGLVLSTDLAMEGVHFRLDWISPEEAGRRAVGGALSDLAAMAAVPIGVLASVAAPDDGALAVEVMRGVRAGVESVGGVVLGGDLTRSPGPLVVDITVVGRADAPLLRSGAEPGHELWVTGALGASAAAVSLWQAGDAPSPALRARFAQPAPRIQEALWLAGQDGVRAGIDLSDGLAGDAAHIAAASGVRIILQTDRIPLDPELGRVTLPSPHSPLSLALHGGEDYELLLAVEAGAFDGRAEEFRRRFDLALTRIGRVEAGEGVLGAHSPDAPPAPLLRSGYDHFSDELP